jgi:hypothetical protein
MSKKSSKTLAWSVAALTLVFVAAGLPRASAQDSVGAALNECAAIEDDAARLACYDALVAVQVDDQDDAGDVGTVTATTATTAVVVADVVTDVVADDAPALLTDDVGRERIEPKSDDDQPRFAASVTSCQKSVQSGQYYFVFENGQVWKQSNYRNLSLRDCAFDVEISKTGFGYQMYIPSKDRTVRVARVK